MAEQLYAPALHGLEQNAEACHRALRDRGAEDVSVKVRHVPQIGAYLHCHLYDFSGVVGRAVKTYFIQLHLIEVSDHLLVEGITARCENNAVFGSNEYVFLVAFD